MQLILRYYALDTAAPLPRLTSRIFILKDLRQFHASLREDYASRLSPLLVTFGLSQFREREHCFELYHSQDIGVNSGLLWSNAEKSTDLFSKIELVGRGRTYAVPLLRFQLREQCTIICDKNRWLVSFAPFPSMAKWLRSIRRVGFELLKDVTWTPLCYKFSKQTYEILSIDFVE